MTKKKKIFKSKALLLLVPCVALCATLALGWMIAKEVYLAESRDVSENKSNIVINTVKAPRDLVSTLLAEKTGCESVTDNGKNIDYIVRVADGAALVHYGCALDSYAFYKKVDGKWSAISPTNQFLYGTPLCSHLKSHDIPASVQAFCYNGPSTNGHIPVIAQNPVK